MNSEIVETVTYEKSDDMRWIHNTHGQNIRIAELVAKGMPPENPASDAYQTMLAVFAAETSERGLRDQKILSERVAFRLYRYAYF